MNHFRFILTACLFFTVLSCKVQKNISQSSTQSDSTTTSVQTHETQTSSSNRLTISAIEAYGNRIHRDGIFDIKFDSLTSIDISPDGAIRATGYAPTIRSHTSETRTNTTVNSSNTSQLIQKDSTGRGEKLEERTASYSQSEKLKDITKTPSLIPWIGAGLAIAIVVLAVLWYFFKRK
ncbi:hypothetical protein [Algoriphagus resistens]|uniref:hypothetical protein n=1 Tax=Algoriphagus resistens TaxID=1750590 RepID=UPI000716AD74|nr:hypothetical protein [Algoriphagus resistens]